MAGGTEKNMTNPYYMTDAEQQNYPELGQPPVIVNVNQGYQQPPPPPPRNHNMNKKVNIHIAIGQQPVDVRRCPREGF